jgi:DNA-binding NtrC family response regulator
MSPRVKILIVDDEPVVRQSFSRILSGERCTAVTAESGAAALQCLEQDSFDLVLLDLRMPGMDGLSLLREIKRRWPEVEVVVVTGYAALDTIKASLALGAFDYLAKPVGPEEIIHVTRGALQHKGWALHPLPQAAACACAAA